jgi:hypothetical protein
VRFEGSTIYGLEFESLIGRMGIDVAEGGTDSIPDRYLFRSQPTVATKRGDVADTGSGFMEKLTAESQEIPLFLR